MYVTDHEPPESRRNGLVTGTTERHMKEGAVQVAFAVHLLELPGSDGVVKVHPDGVHAQQTDFVALLRGLGFERDHAGPLLAGTYVRGSQRIEIGFYPGRGDVVGNVNGETIVAEAKGACINTRHAGQLSKQRKALFECIGSLFQRPSSGERQVAVVPLTAQTKRLAEKIAARVATAGIEIALVAENGHVELVAT